MITDTTLIKKKKDACKHLAAYKLSFNGYYCPACERNIPCKPLGLLSTLNQ